MRLSYSKCVTLLCIFGDFCNVSELILISLTLLIMQHTIKFMLHLPLELGLKNSALCNGGIHVGWRTYFFILSK